MKSMMTLLALGAACPLFSGCVVREPAEIDYPVVDEPEDVAVVTAAPPPAEIEVVPAPVVGQVWVPGYWWWGPQGYVWVHGRYAVGRPGTV